MLKFIILTDSIAMAHPLMLVIKLVLLLFQSASLASSSQVLSSLNILPDIYQCSNEYSLFRKLNFAIGIEKSLQNSDDPAYFICRNVPGYGSCLFYALASCITFERCKQHFDFSSKQMKSFALRLRQKAVEILKTSTIKKLYLEHNESISSATLLDMVASHSKTTPDKYCENMLKPKTWGSGTEIVALSNYFQRPIHVYELKSRPSRSFFWFSRPSSFVFSQCASFGAATFRDQQPYHLLCADGRFPWVTPGEQRSTGNHFLALFPLSVTDFDRLRQKAMAMLNTGGAGAKGSVVSGNKSGKSNKWSSGKYGGTWIRRKKKMMREDSERCADNDTVEKSYDERELHATMIKLYFNDAHMQSRKSANLATLPSVSASAGPSSYFDGSAAQLHENIHLHSADSFPEKEIFDL